MESYPCEPGSVFPGAMLVSLRSGDERDRLGIRQPLLERERDAE